MKWAWTIVACGLAGCIGPRETQFLTCAPRPPEVERRAYDAHDPFADEDLGPDTSTRPRTFQEPRSDTRKNFDLRLLQGVHPRTNSPVFARGPSWPGHYPPTLSGTERFPIAPSNSPPVGPIASNSWWDLFGRPNAVPAY